MAPRCSDHSVFDDIGCGSGHLAPEHLSDARKTARTRRGSWKAALGVVVLTDLPRAPGAQWAHRHPPISTWSDAGRTPREAPLSFVPSHGWLERVYGRQHRLVAIRFHRRRDCEHIVNPHSLLELAVWGWDAARCDVCADG